MENEKLELVKTVIGEYSDIIKRYDEENNVIEEIVTPLKKNIITIGISQYAAGLIQGLYTGNYAFWAVGTGSQPNSPNTSQLVAEYSRKQVAVNFVDNTNSIVTTPTTKIVMAVSWAKGELGTVTLTEFGIFAGTGANIANGGIMLDNVNHAPISLDSTLSLSRKIYFSF